MVQKDTNYLDRYAEKCKIFIDTCSLLDDSASVFLQDMAAYLIKHDNRLIIPVRVYEELEKHSKNTHDADLATKAQNAMVQVTRLDNLGLISFQGEDRDTFADNVFLYVFRLHRLQHNLLLITQDNKLGQDILRINEDQCVKGKKVTVRRLTKSGKLGRFYWDQPTTAPSGTAPRPPQGTAQPVPQRTAPLSPTAPPIKQGPQHQSQGIPPEGTVKKPYTPKVVPPEQIFTLATSITTLSNQAIPNVQIPKQGDSALSLQDKKMITLLEEVGNGGEGYIYKTNTPFVAKIYNKDNITDQKEAKLKRMISKDIRCKGICYPVDLLYNQQGQFVGYLMPQAQGKELQRSLFIKALFLENFPDWKKEDITQLCITILYKIKYLHDRNIILGDINPANILVISPKEVYFVDTDSYQIEEFPCPVGTVNYTAPEIQGKKYSDFLRTKENEYFAVATLLFMLLITGKTPYAQQGGEDQMRNIAKMDFSYPLGENSNKKTPEGPWRFLWSHLTYHMKQSFYETFRPEGQFSKPEDRLSTDAWLDQVRRYHKVLVNGRMEAQDPMSLALYPDRLKRNPNATYINCRLCSKEVEDKRSREGICQNCLDDGEIYPCKGCGTDVLYKNYRKYISKGERLDLCQNCFEKKRAGVAYYTGWDRQQQPPPAQTAPPPQPTPQQTPPQQTAPQQSYTPPVQTPPAPQNNTGPLSRLFRAFFKK